MRSTRGALLCLVLSLLGISVCAYLVFLHLGLLRGELLGGIACGTSGSFNCHAVTSSPWSAWFGMPLSFWGLIGYIGTLTLALLVWAAPDCRTNALTVLVAVSSLFIAIDAILFGVMALQIRYFCPLCLSTYAINLGLLVSALWSLGTSLGSALQQAPRALISLLPSRKQPATLLAALVLCVAIASIVGLHVATVFVAQGDRAVLRKQLHDFVANQPQVSVDTASDPAVGPVNAPLQLVEFSDLFCPVCQRASKFNTIMLAAHRDAIHFVFKHFPLDMNCNDTVTRSVHPGACLAAAATECAHQQGKFWPFHDRIFEKGHDYDPTNLSRDAVQLGLNTTQFERCMSSGAGMEAVKQDIAEGKRLGITSTPTYIVNGLKVPGVLTPALFGELVDALHDVQHR